MQAKPSPVPSHAPSPQAAPFTSPSLDCLCLARLWPGPVMMPLAHMDGEMDGVCLCTCRNLWILYGRNISYWRKVRVAALGPPTFASGPASCWHTAAIRLPTMESGPLKEVPPFCFKKPRHTIQTTVPAFIYHRVTWWWLQHNRAYPAYPCILWYQGTRSSCRTFPSQIPLLAFNLLLCTMRQQ